MNIETTFVGGVNPFGEYTESQDRIDRKRKVSEMTDEERARAELLFPPKKRAKYYRRVYPMRVQQVIEYVTAHPGCDSVAIGRHLKLQDSQTTRIISSMMQENKIVRVLVSALRGRTYAYYIGGDR